MRQGYAMKWTTLLAAALLFAGCQQTQVAAPKELAMTYPPLPILAPTAFTFTPPPGVTIVNGPSPI